MAFGIKQTLLDSEAANYATAAEDRKSFYEETIMPRARLFEDALNAQLLERDGLRLEFKFNEMDIFQTDESERADLLHKLMNSEMPIELALDLAGYELTDDQLAMLRAHNAKEPQVEKPEDELEQVIPTGGVPNVEPQEAELRKWQRMAEKRVKESKPIREFQSNEIEPGLHGAISGALEEAQSVDDVKRIFEGVFDWRGYP